MIRLFSNEEYQAIKDRADKISKAADRSPEEEIELEILKQLLYNYECRNNDIGSKSIKLKDFKKLLSDSKDNLAFIFGNGINRYAWVKDGDYSDISWEGMLLNLWKDVCDEDFLIRDYNNNPKIPDDGITYTEFFNILENILQEENRKLPKHKRVGLKKRTKKYVIDHINSVKQYHLDLQSLLEKNFNCPVMTTNYDYNIGVDLDFDSEFKKLGYQRPEIVYWNVEARRNNVPVTQNELGVKLVSGSSKNIIDMVTNNDSIDPLDFMNKVLVTYKFIDELFPKE